MSGFVVWGVIHTVAIVQGVIRTFSFILNPAYVCTQGVHSQRRE